MKTVTARDAHETFPQLLEAVEQGETVRITRDGKTVAELRPQSVAAQSDQPQPDPAPPSDRRQDPLWQAKFEHMMKLMRETPDTGYRVGKITEDDKYGDAPPLT